jgi:hypothetical protein
VALVVLVAGCASAPERPPGEPPAQPGPFEACRQAGENQVVVLDATRRTLYETVCGASLWLDGLFGEGDVATARSTRGRLEVAASHSDFEGDDTRVRFHARVRLPALKRQLSAFVGRDDEEDFTRDRSEGLGLRDETDQLDDIEDWFAGLGYSLRETGIKTEFRVGVRGIRNTKVFAQGRATYVAYEDDVNLIQVRATPFVNNRDGWGFTLTTDFDHALAPTRLLRWGTAGTATEESAGVEWRSAVVLYQNLGNMYSVAPEVFVRGATAAPEPLAEYGVRTIFRMPLFQARLFANLIPGYSWPRNDPLLPREGSFSATVGLELPFGKHD